MIAAESRVAAAAPVRSRQVVWLAITMGLALGLLTVSFIAFEWRAIQRNRLAEVEVYARALEDQVSGVIANSDHILLSLAPTIETLSAHQEWSRLDTLLENSARGRPFLRSLSWVDAQGNILASSNAGNRARRVAPAIMSARPLEPTLIAGAKPMQALVVPGAFLSALLAGRDLDDLRVIESQATRSTSLALPMLLAIPGRTGGGQLIALINPDHLANQLDRMLGTEPLRAIVLSLDARLIGVSSQSSLVSGGLLPQLPSLTNVLSNQEHASAFSDGSQGAPVLSAFRLTRKWPLLVLVERPAASLVNELSAIAQWALAFLLTSCVLLGAGTSSLRRALRRDERLTRDLAQAHAAANASEIALGEARTRELALGAQIQRALLVTAAPAPLTGLQLSVHSQASQGVDGDFVEVIALGSTCIDIITGDVMGKGVAAALMGAAAKMQISRSIAERMLQRESRERLPSPVSIVAAMHRAMTPALQSLDAFVTLCYLRIDLEQNTITWVGCGHEASLLVPLNGKSELLGNQQPPLGVLGDLTFQQDVRSFVAGDGLFLCSDGLTDARHHDGAPVGRARASGAMIESLRTHASSAAALHRVRQVLLPARTDLQDDLTLMVIRRPAVDLGASHSALEIPVSLRALPFLRAGLEQRCGLRESDPGDETTLGLLIVAVVEAFTNIVRHATGLIPQAPVELMVAGTANTLTIELIYVGDAYTPPAHAAAVDFDAYPECGFGLHILRRACDRVDYEHHGGVNTVRLHSQLTRGVQVCNPDTPYRSQTGAIGSWTT